MQPSRTESVGPASRDWLGTDAKVIRHIRVCGAGQLAAATRLELTTQGILRDSDYLLPSLRPDLIIACADSEMDGSCGSDLQRAVDAGSPVLFGCLVGQQIRVGPLVNAEPYWPAGPDPVASAHTGTAFAEPVPMTITPTAASTPALSTAAAATRTLAAPFSVAARMGALLLSTQALNFLLNARNQCVRGRFIDLNPYSMESKTYKVVKVRQ